MERFPIHREPADMEVSQCLEHRDRLVTALTTQEPDDLHDPVEDDPEVRPKIEAATRQAESELAEVSRDIGFCHKFWALKKKILRRNYGIDWKTPAEMNPGTFYD